MIAVLLCALTVSFNTDEVFDNGIYQQHEDVLQEYAREEEVFNSFLDEQETDDQYVSYGYIFNFDLPKYLHDIFPNIPYDTTNKELKAENLQLKEENSVLKHYIQTHKENEVDTLNFMLQLMVLLFLPSIFVGFCLSCRYKKKQTPVVIDVEPLEIKKEEIIKV